MDYTAIIQDDQFQRLAAFLRAASRPAWLAEHPASKFGFYFNNFARHARAYHSDLNGDLVADYAGMVSSAVEADTRLSGYMTTDVLDWFVGILGEADAGTVLALLLAVSACEDTMLTPVEAAEASGMSESHWRNQAAAGSIPGAQKKGKQWLIPRSWIRYSQFAE